ncbi:T9SS type A sorting domain-containing protein [Winogradskyella aurantiaca]
MYNSIGTAVQSGQVIDDEKIDVSRLTEGMYIIKLGHSKALKFAKN